MSSIPPPRPSVQSAEAVSQLDIEARELSTEELELDELSHDVRDLSSHIGGLYEQVREVIEGLENDEQRAQCESHLADLGFPESGQDSFLRKVDTIRAHALVQRRRVNADTRSQLNDLASSIYGLNSALQAVREHANELLAEQSRPPEPAESPQPENVEEPVTQNPTSASAENDEAAPQRRAHRRHPVQAAVTFESENNFYTGFSQDISGGGLFVATVDVLPRGSIVELTVKMPDGTSVDVSGEVRWIREYNEQTPHVYPGMGVQFTGLTPQAQDTIASFLTQRESLFYEE